MLHPETERKALGARLAKVRAEAGYTLEAAAQALTERGFKIGRAAIGAWETGRNVPDALAMRWMARLYQVPVDVLYADAAVELETIQLAARLKAVVLSDRQVSDSQRQTRTSERGRTDLMDELFNLTNEGMDASDQSRRKKGHGGGAGSPRTGGPRRKG